MHKEARLSSLQRASQLATKCLTLTSRTFLSTNEAGGRRSVCVCMCVAPSYSMRCVCFWKIESRETEWRSNGVGSTAHFQRAVWHSLEGMCGWISLLAATVTFQWGSTLSSPLSNPCWNEHLCKMKMRPEIMACLSVTAAWTDMWCEKLNTAWSRLSICKNVWFALHNGMDIVMK